MLNKKNDFLRALYVTICASPVIFSSCGNQKKVSQDDFMKDARDKIVQSPNSLNAEFTANCDPTYTNKIIFNVLNKEQFSLRCNLNEYDFFSSSINPKALSRTEFTLNAAESFVANILFRQGFPKNGVAMTIMCIGDGKTFRDIKLVNCST